MEYMMLAGERGESAARLGSSPKAGHLGEIKMRDKKWEDGDDTFLLVYNRGYANGVYAAVNIIRDNENIEINLPDVIKALVIRDFRKLARVESL